MSTILELQVLAKRRGIRRFNKYSKEKLLEILSVERKEESTPTFVELKKMARKRGIKGYGKLSEEKLIELLRPTESTPTFVELKTMARKRGIKGYGYLPKKNLCELLDVEYVEDRFKASPILVENVESGEIKKYPSLTKLALDAKKNPGLISYYISRKKAMKINCEHFPPGEYIVSKEKNVYIIKEMNRKGRNSMSENVYEKFKKIFLEQKEEFEKKTQKQEKIIKQQEEKIRRQEEKIKKQRIVERRRLEKVKQQDLVKREKALKRIREKWEKADKERLDRERKQWEKANKQRLDKIRKQWDKEIRQEEKRQAKFMEESRWRGSKKKFRDVRNRLDKKLKKIYKQGKNLRPRLVSEAFRRNTSKWSISGGNFKDPLMFLNTTTPAVERLINSIDSIGKKVNTVLVCKLVKSDPATGNVEITITHFRSKTHSVISPEDTTREYEIMREKMLESLAKFQIQGSGWQLQSVEELEIFITKYRPLNGNSYKPLPNVIQNKKAVINMENDDDECFKWAVTRALNPVGRENKNPGRISNTLIQQSEKLNWKGVEFPMNIKDITQFEENNGVIIHVLSYDIMTKKVFTLKIGKFMENNEKCIILFLYDDHYSVVKDLSRLVSKQLSKKGHKKFICIRCLSASFGTSELLNTHLELCKNHDHQHHVYPSGKSKITYFKQYHKLHKLPFVVYADFESFINKIQTVENNPNKSHTTQYQKHEPSGFCYHIKCFDDKIYKGKTVLYTMKEEGEDIGKRFVECLEKDLKEVYKILNICKPIKMTKKDERNFKKAKDCYACGKELGIDRVRDHCHHTGRYRGAAHSKCNLSMKQPKFVPVLFHNLEGYDSHLFIKSMGLSPGLINCIPKTDEKYISFSKEIVMETYIDKKGKEKEKKLEIRFLDSLKFTLKSLDSLVGNLSPDQFKTLEGEMGPNELLKKKGVFPYEFMDGYNKLEYNKLPPKEEFFSKLNNTNICDKDYKHAQNVWSEFGCETMRDYHDLYLKTDVLLLADVMENYRDICIKNYGLDPMWYYTAPGLAWDAALKISGVKLELLTDPDMHLLVENGIRGGISTIIKRYGKANNEYMKKYHPKEESVFLPYLDANNLYGWAMSKPLPVDGFEWMDDGDDWKSISEKDGEGCILEVDLEYPRELHNLHNEYPLAPERLKVNKVDKLIPNLMNKKKYVLHYKNLELYLSLGLKLKKIHRGIKFNERPWLKDYIQLNTNLRTKGTTDFEKDFFKLMNNSVFGKTMENVRNRIDVRLINNTDEILRFSGKINFKGVNIFTKNLVAVHMHKTTVKLNKPIYLGMSILDLSKTLMYDFHYNYIKSKYGDDANLLFTDTDSLCYEIKTQDFYKDIADDVHSKFDTSNFDKNHPSRIPVGINKKVIGMMKDEAGGKQISEFVGLRSKLYAYKMDEGFEEKKCKGVKKGVVKKEITLEDYKTCLFGGEKQYRSMNTFRSRKHDIYTERINKVALSSNDDKRYIREGGVETWALGHWRIGSGSEE